MSSKYSVPEMAYINEMPMRKSADENTAVKRYLAPDSYESPPCLLKATNAAIGSDAVSRPMKKMRKCPDEIIRYIPKRVKNNSS